MNVFCFIFARGGSKSVKNKNIVNFNNKPLIANTILNNMRMCDNFKDSRGVGVPKRS